MSLLGSSLLSIVWGLGFALGLATGLGLDFLWRRTGISKYERRLEIVEHYHWGTTLLTLIKILWEFNAAFFFVAGIGTTLILAEITQNHPFALKSSHGLSSTIVGGLLVVWFLITWTAK